MHCLWRFFAGLAACILQVFVAFAQTGNYTSYTAANGLPSNNVYRVLEDGSGFLWIVTDAGVARFDGKRFQVYTTKEGLPDNDIIYLEKEKDGRIWVAGIKQCPAYFDERKNRFVSPIDGKMQRWFENTADANLIKLKNGGIRYENRYKFLIFENGKLVKYGERIPGGKWEKGSIEEFPDGFSLLYGGYLEKKTDWWNSGIYYYKDEKKVDSMMIVSGARQKVKQAYSNDGNIYLWNLNDKECIILSDIKRNPIRFKKDTIRLPELAVTLVFSEKSMYFQSYSGKQYVYDKKTFRHTHTFGGDYLPNGFGEDSKGNVYVTTVDKGIRMYRNNPVKKITLPGNFTHTNFLSIAYREDGVIFAGNYYGEIAEISGDRFKLHKTNNIVTAKIRKILFSGNNVYTFSEQGIYRNYKERILTPRVNISFAKTAISFNDSIILIGTHVGLVEFNTRTQKTKELIPNGLSGVLRNTALAKASDSIVYFGSTNGLYKFNYKTNKYHLLTDVRQRISSLCHTQDGLLWVSTSSGKILALKDDKIILNTFLSNETNRVIRYITAGRAGQVWVSTSHGINRIQYKLNGTKLSYNIRNLSIDDGLLSNEVKEMVYHEGKIYAATSNGISVIPENYAIQKTDIPTYLVRMSINSKQSMISQSYQLKYGRQDLQMQFSGVDLNGYFKSFQYRLDNSEWIKLDGNMLNIQLRTGNHHLSVRSVDVNGNVSSRELVLFFEVAVPFWLNIWFWIGMGVIVQIVLFYLLNRYQKRKREAKLARKVASVQSAAIEQQAFTSLMNPHFMFNALNSIQHYINLQDRKSANRYLSDFASLIRRNFEAAQQSFIPLEEEIENIKIYLTLESMRFNDRFRYTIEIEDSLETEDWMIPTMMLQPLLENALLHGIMPSSLPGEISVRFVQEEQDLLIIITDNGIGIANSLALKAGNRHKSRGMELIGRRIRALSHFGKKPMTMVTEPAFNSNTHPGNKVTLLVPNSLYDSWRIAHT